MPQCLAQPLRAELLPVHRTGVSRTEVNLHLGYGRSLNRHDPEPSQPEEKAAIP
jgi:hypothetical protein